MLKILSTFKSCAYKIAKNLQGENKDKFIDLLQEHSPYFQNKKGIEIGGPSKIFEKTIPVYSLAEKVDGCNFSNHTIWEGNLELGDTYKYFDQRIGYQYILEAGNLSSIPDDKYDFLISSHCMEHCANPIAVVEEWLRVIKPGGAILLVLPAKDFTFDHKRNITAFEHLLEDYKNKVDESDLTHLPEIFALHDLKRDLDAGSMEQFKKRSYNNVENRGLHHHVFDFRLLKKIFDFYQLNNISTYFIPPFHQVIIGVK